MQIVHAATVWHSPETGQTYILVLNEAQCTGNTLDHTLLNPNQLCNYRNRVQDNLMLESTLSIINEDGKFSTELSMKGTILFDNTHTPSDKQLRECPYFNLRSPHPSDPMKVCFPKFSW